MDPRNILKVEQTGLADEVHMANETKRRAIMISKIWTELMKECTCHI